MRLWGRLPLLLMKRKWVCLLRVPTFLFALALFLPGCHWADWMRPEAVRHQKQEETSKNKAADPSSDFMTSGEKFAFHRWLITEMKEQIFARPITGDDDVDGWANVLSQRGSVEGVYHGLILTPEYSALEKGRADLKALRFFSHEMAVLDNPNVKDGQAALKEAQAKYTKDNLDTPLFALKRVLGEKILKEAEARKGDRNGLAVWYASFASRWAKLGVPFGMSQRNSDNEAFHYKWALENNLGMIEWELLNREHRILNSFGGFNGAPEVSKALPAKISASPAPDHR